jgi:hypothetical protein
MTDYQIQPSTRRCCVSGRELQPGERCFSVLLDQGGRFVRRDYAPEAWTGPPADVFSFWAGRVSGSEGKPRPVIDDELLMDCFARLETSTEPARLRFRYVVGLLLMRRKRLRFEEARTEDGKEVLLLRCARKGGKYRVINPCLSDAEMAQVQDDVFQALGWDVA